MNIYEDQENITTPVKSIYRGMNRKALTPINENKSRNKESLTKKSGKISSKKKRVRFISDSIEETTTTTFTSEKNRIEASFNNATSPACRESSFDLDTSYVIHSRANISNLDGETPTHVTRLISNVPTPMQSSLKKSMRDVARTIDDFDDTNVEDGGNFKGNISSDNKHQTRGGVSMNLALLLPPVTTPREKAAMNDDINEGNKENERKTGKKIENYPVLTLGNFHEAIWLHYGDESQNIVGKTRVMPFILRAPENGQESYTLAAERVPQKHGFHFVLDDGQTDDNVAEIHLKKGDSKLLKLAWTPVSPVGVRHAFYFKTLVPLGRLRVTVFGEARGISSAKSKKTKRTSSNRKKSIKNHAPGKTPLRIANTNSIHDRVEVHKTPKSHSSTCTPKSSLVGSVSKDKQSRMYDQNWATKQSESFKLMLNFILQPNTEGNELKDNGTIQEGCESSQSLSAFRTLLLHRQQEKVRQRASICYMAEDMKHFRSELKARISSGRLSARTDRDLSANLTLRRQISDLLLSYSLSWLQLGLETIFKETIDGILSPRPAGSPGQDVVKKHFQGHQNKLILKQFIIKRIFNDHTIQKKYTGGKCNVPSGKFEVNYKEELRRHSLYYIILLIAFLDRTKKENLLETTPRLFSKDGVVKSTCDILISISREYLHGEGNVVKHLSRMGFEATYNQAPIDEVDLKIKKLSTDLRDGVRLVRLIEILKEDMSMSLSKDLRIPSLSRLQKLHNADIAIRALKDDGVPNIENVDKHHIVDGHQLQVLQLLWSIISHFKIASLINIETLNDEIERVHCFNKKRNNPFTFERSYSARCDHVVEYDDKFTILLLKWCQEICSFYSLSIENFTSSFADGKAICALMSYYHPGILRMDEIQCTTRDLALEIQESSKTNRTQALQNERRNWALASSRIAYIGGIPNMHLEMDTDNPPEERSNIAFIAYLCARLIESSKEIMATLVIQRSYRRYQKNLLQLKQRNYSEEHQEKCTYKEIHEDQIYYASNLIQSIYRQWKERKVFVKKQFAVKIIHHVCLSYINKKKSNAAIKDIILLQSHFRMQSQLRSFQQIKEAAVSIQRRIRECRFHLCREVREVNVVILQKYVRGYLARKSTCVEISQVILLQSVVRGFLKYKAYHLRLHSIIKLQAFQRKRLCCQAFKRKKESTIMIEKAYQSWKFARERKRQRTTLHAVIRIQASVRCFLIRQAYHGVVSTVIRLQSWLRSNLVKSSYIEMKKSAIIIQAVIRRALVCKQLGIESAAALKIQLYCRVYLKRTYLISKKAATIIQKEWRTYVVRTVYVSKMNSIYIIQSNIRAHLHHSRTNKEQKAVCKIQSAWGEFRSKANFLLKKNCAICIQAFLRMCINRNTFLMQRKAVSNIQIQYRIWKTRNVAAIIVQRNWRCYVVQVNFTVTVAAVVSVQAKVRGRLHMRDFHTVKAGVIVLQGVMRGVFTREKLRNEFSGACLIQKIWRGYDAYSNYNLTQIAAVVIQAYARRMIAIKSYARRENAIIQIQSYMRGALTRSNIAFDNYSASLIQCTWRRFNEQMTYRIVLSKVVTIQAWFRACSTSRRFSSHRDACIIIQKMFRGTIVRNHMLQIQTTAVVIQAYGRRMIAMTSYARRKNAIIQIQSYMRGALTRFNIAFDNYSASLIQCTWRRFNEQMTYRIVLSKVVTIQAWFRASSTSRRFRCHRDACIVIQKTFRRTIVRNHMLQIQTTAVVIQAYARRMIAMTSYARRKNAIIQIQSYMRGALTRSNIAFDNYSASLIQCTWRRFNEQRTYRIVLSKVVTIQAWFRACSASRRFSSHLDACIIIQKMFRRTIVRNHMLQIQTTAVVIQAYARRMIAMTSYARRKNAIIQIQSYMRGALTRSNIAFDNYSASLIQCTWRRFNEQMTYRIVLSKVVTIQAWFRACSTSRRFRCHRDACIIIQKMFRGTIVRNHMLQIQTTAVVIQAYGRRMIAMTSYARRKNAIIQIQSYMRGALTRSNIAFDNYSASLIQCTWRRFNEQMTYRIVLSKVVTIQAWFRACSTSRRFSSQRNACIVIQKTFRGTIVRNHTLLNHYAAREIQRILRGHLVRAYTERSNDAALVLQSYRRGYLTRREIKDKKRCATTVQSFVRGFLTRKYTSAFSTCKRTNVLQAHLAAERIQKMVRCQMRNRKMEHSAIIITHHLRALILKRKVSIINNSVVIVQSTYRGFRTRMKRGKTLCLIAHKVDRANKIARRKPEMTLGRRTHKSLNILLTSNRLTEIIRALETLETCTRLSKECCIAFSNVNATAAMYDFIQKCNRSVPHLELITNSLQTLTNVIQYTHLVASVGTSEAVNVLVELIQTFRDKDKIFSLAVKLLEKLCRSNKKYLDQCTSHEHAKRLERFHKDFVRKKQTKRKGFRSLETIVYIVSKQIRQEKDSGH